MLSFFSKTRKVVGQFVEVDVSNAPGVSMVIMNTIGRETLTEDSDLKVQ